MDVGMEYEILMLQLGSLARKLFNAEENLSKYQEALEKATRDTWKRRTATSNGCATTASRIRC